MLDVPSEISDNSSRMSKLKTPVVLIFIAAAVLNPHTLHAHQAAANQAPANNDKSEAKTREALALLQQVKAAALRIKDNFQRDLLLEGIGVGQAKAGDFDAAIETANQASLPATNTLREMGEQLGNANDLPRAQALGRKLKVGGVATILSALANSQARKGNIDGALRSAELIGIREIRSYALESIATRQAANGDYAGAQKTFSLARETYSSGLVSADDLEMFIVANQLSRGEMQAARVRIGSFNSPEQKFAARIAGAEELWKKGDHTEANKWLKDALKELPTGSESEILRYFAIPFQVKLSQKESAMLAAGALSSDWRVKGYMAVAITCAETKDVAGVTAAVQKMRLASRSVHGTKVSEFGLKLMILNVTAALIDNGQFHEADGLLSTLERQSDDVSFKMGIEPTLQLQRVLMLALENRFGAAHSLALKMRLNSITDVHRGTALRITAYLETKKNGISQSLTWARALVNTEDRAYALLGIAQALLEIEDVKLPYSAIQIH